MRILVWHGWLLEGTGSNVYTSRVADVWRREGHRVLLVCQEPRPERFPFVDAWGAVGDGGVGRLDEAGRRRGAGEVVLLRPDIGRLLPVFVYDDYEGFDVKRFVELSDPELDAYLARNVEALAAAAAWFRPDVVIAGHAVPGAPVARRALGTAPYVAKVHGSDLEYAVRLQPRYRELAAEGLAGARSVVGASRDVLARTITLVPEAGGRTRVVPPGVEVARWKPLPRRAALETLVSLLERDPDTARGRSPDLDGRVLEAIGSRDAAALDRLARSYDQTAPDRDAAERLRALTGDDRPLVGYLGKFIPQKGVERFLEALALLGPGVRGVLIGFGMFREWLSALVTALDSADAEAAAWLAEASPMRLELGPDEVRAAAGLRDRATFTGRLDHRYAPEAVAALDVLVVPSTLEEAFGMVAAEGAAAGAVPVVARHSALAEVADALEAAAGRSGLLSFEPGPGATGRLAGALRGILALPAEERAVLREAVRRHVISEWSWERTAERLLEAAGR